MASDPGALEELLVKEKNGGLQWCVAIIKEAFLEI